MKINIQLETNGSNLHLDAKYVGYALAELAATLVDDVWKAKSAQRSKYEIDSGTVQGRMTIRNRND